MTRSTLLAQASCLPAAAALSFCIALGGCSIAFDTSTITTGRITGAIAFGPMPFAGPLQQYLAGNAPVGGALQSVRAHRLTDSAVMASNAYAFASTPTPGELARYDIHPFVEPEGRQFRLSVKNLAFANGAYYRFGDEYVTTSPHITPLVTRDSEDATTMPDGVVLDIKECPALAQVKITLTGASADLDLLQSARTCTVTAELQEGPTYSSVQADSGPAPVVLSDLKGSGSTVPLLLRSSMVANLVATCTLVTTATGFPRDPSRPPDETMLSTRLAARTFTCGEATAIDAAIPVERGAGVLKGLLDVREHDEARDLRITLSPGGQEFVSSSQGTLGTPPHAWSFEGVPQGRHGVSAKVVLDGGRTALEFPNLKDGNAVDVVPNGTTDLGNTFIARAHHTSGSVVLRDPRSLAGLGTNLQWLHTGLFGWTRYAMQGPERTAVVAVGTPEVFVDPVTGTIGGSGVNAQALSVPEGSFDPALGEARLTYRLPLVGLSARTGPADGSGALTTEWSVKSIDVGINKVVGGTQEFFQRTRIDLGRVNRINATPGGANAGPDVNICFGEARITMAPSQPGALLHGPSIGIAQEAVAAAVDDRNQPITYSFARGDAHGKPREQEPAEPSVAVGATLPAGIRYRYFPSVSLQPAGSAARTFLTLPEEVIPPSGGLQCGEELAPCRLVDGSGAVEQVDVRITSPAAFCQAGSSITVGLAASAPGGTLDRVELVVDGAAQELCGTCAGCAACANPLAMTRTVSGLTPGVHGIRLVAHRGMCPAVNSVTVQVTDPASQCPGDFTVVLNAGENSITPADPRISGWLNPQATGGCAASTITHDHPTPFPLGETQVGFALDGAPICQRKLTVIQSAKQIAFFDGDRLKLYRLEDNQFAFDADMAAAGGAGPIAFNATGSRIAVRQSGRITFLNAHTGAIDPVVLGGNFTAFAYRPGTGSDHASVEDGGSGGHLLRFNLGGSSLFQVIPGLPPPAGASVSPPQLAWSSDGARLVVAYVRSSAGGPALVTVEWTLAGAQATAASPREWPAAAGEELRAIAHAQGARYLIATSARFLRVLNDGTLEPGMDLPVNRVDLHRSELLGVDIGQNEPWFLFVVSELGVLYSNASAPFWGPYGPVMGIAVSDYPYSALSAGDPALAVAMPHYVPPAAVRRAVALYRIAVSGSTASLVLDRWIPAQAPAYPVFRPWSTQ